MPPRRGALPAHYLLLVESVRRQFLVSVSLFWFGFSFVIPHPLSSRSSYIPHLVFIPAPTFIFLSFSRSFFFFLLLYLFPFSPFFSQFILISLDPVSPRFFTDLSLISYSYFLQVTLYSFPPPICLMECSGAGIIEVFELPRFELVRFYCILLRMRHFPAKTMAKEMLNS